MRNILIVGAGVSGLVIARELTGKGFNVTVIDKNNHIAGNCFDYINEHNIRIHKYGPHIFHTNNKEVFEWLSRFTEWVEYKHKVKAMLSDGALVTFPINNDTKKIVKEEDLVETFLRPYSEKMWGMKLEELSNDIINRVPSRNDNNDLYFPDSTYQFMPKNGYTKMFENIIGDIKVKLLTNFEKTIENDYDYIFNSMPIDEYYDYRFGELQYRSIVFTNVNLPVPKLFPVSTVNFTHNSPYTRITEWKNFPNHGSNNSVTSLTYEKPCDYKDNERKRFYPVKDLEGKNNKLYEQYKNIENNKTTFIGRLGMYKYINMDEAVKISLDISKSFIEKYGK